MSNLSDDDSKILWDLIENPPPPNEALVRARDRMLALLATQYKERWYWCGTCCGPTIKLSVCGNNTCNGGGCRCESDNPICLQEIRDETLLFKFGLVPTKEQIPPERVWESDSIYLKELLGGE